MRRHAPPPRRGVARSVSRAALAGALGLLVAAASEGDEPGRDAVPGHLPADQPLILPAAERERVNEVAEQLICYCGCARQTVRDCTCGIADDIKKGIWSDLGEGKGLDAIVAAYIGEHGPEFRSMPDRRGPLGALAFALPYVAIGLALVVILPVVKRWTRRAGGGGPPAPPGAASGDGAGGARDYAARVDAELADLD